MTSASVTAHLKASGVNAGGWRILTGGLSDRENAPQIAVIDAPGLPPLDSHDAPTPLRAGIRVLVRGAPDTFVPTAQKAEAVWVALHRRSFAGVLLCSGDTSPAWLGFTSDDRRPQWSLNFTAITE